VKPSKLPSTLIHFAAPDAYRSIFRHGLRCTRVLIDDFGLPAADADRLMSAPRPDFVTLGPHPKWGTVRLAHNRPLLGGSQQVLARSLELGECTLEEFCRLLADRVFFWAYERDAAGYRGNIREIGAFDRIDFDTNAVLRLAREQDREVQVSRYNSGSVPRSPHVRGRRTWTAVGEATRIKELVVVGRIDGLSAAAQTVTRFHADGTTRQMWARGSSESDVTTHAEPIKNSIESGA
jgi:hypothetical protein